MRTTLSLLTCLLVAFAFTACGARTRTHTPVPTYTYSEPAKPSYKEPPPPKLKFDLETAEEYYQLALEELADTERYSPRVDALISLQQAIRKDGDYLPAHDLFQELRTMVNSAEVTLEDYREYLAENPDDPVALYYYMRALIPVIGAPLAAPTTSSDEALAEAADLERQAMKLNMDNDLTEAIEVTTKALKLAPEYVPAHLRKQGLALQSPGYGDVIKNLPVVMDELHDEYAALAKDFRYEINGNFHYLAERVKPPASRQEATQRIRDYITAIASGTPGVWLWFGLAERAEQSASFYEQGSAQEICLLRLAHLLYSSCAMVEANAVYPQSSRNNAATLAKDVSKTLDLRDDWAPTHR